MTESPAGPPPTSSLSADCSPEVPAVASGAFRPEGRFSVGADGSVYLYADVRANAYIVCDYDEDEDEDGTRTDGILIRWPDGRVQDNPTRADVARWMRMCAGQA